MIVEARPPFDYYLGDDIPEWESFEVSSVGGLLAVQFSDNDPTHFVVVQQADQPGNPWGLPAGRVESEDQYPEDTIIREVRQEVGIELTYGQLAVAKYKVTNKTATPNRGVIWFRTVLNAQDIPNLPPVLDLKAPIQLEPDLAVNRDEILRIGLIPIPYVLTRRIFPHEFYPIYHREYTEIALPRLLHL